MMRFLRWLWLLPVLVLGGCGDPLVTSYGTVDTNSVNGLTVFQHRLMASTRLRRFHLLSPRLERDCRVLVHVARTPGVPDAEACAWLRNWLAAEDGREVVLILRDGNLAPWLCRTWAEQARREASHGGPMAERLTTLAERLDKRADDEKEPAWEADKTSLSASTQPAHPGPAQNDDDNDVSVIDDSPLVTVLPGAAQRPQRVQGDAKNWAVPKGMILGNRVTLPGVEAAPWFRTFVPGEREPLVWAQCAALGKSRLVVVSSATPLLDGALPDAAARALSDRLIERILAPYDRTTPACAWVNTLTVRSDEPRAANPMAMIFTLPPISWCTWHAIAALLVGLAAGAWWLGRREHPRDHHPDRFRHHVDALARHLRDGAHADWCARAIARCRGLPPPSQPLPDADAARTWLSTTAASSDTSAHPSTGKNATHDASH